MNVRAYYNEIDDAAAAVLRELIGRGVIADGDVDTRSIRDVRPDDIANYTQCHFFAGGGLWSVAARLAGWPDERELWTGSCPCQPFSAAGKGLGVDDARHLWPDFHRLISAGRPAIVMGEQVAGAAGYGWFDGVGADLARENYASRCVDIPACAVDAPHQRNRLYWIAVADTVGQRRSEAIGEPRNYAAMAGEKTNDRAERSHGINRILGDTARQRRREGWPEHELRSGRDAIASTDVQLQPDADSSRCSGRPEGAERSAEQRAATERPLLRNGSWWSDAEWIVSPLDGKARRAKPGIPFLVDGLVGRSDLWRLCGNSIVPILAAEVIAAYLDCE